MTQTSSAPTTPQLSPLSASPTTGSPPPAVLPDLSHASPATPVRKIFTQDDILPFTQSQPFSYIEIFIQNLSLAVDGKRIEDECKQSQASAAREG